MRSRLNIVIGSFIILLLVNAAAINADVLRNMEVVITNGNKLPNFINNATPVHDIFVYAYDADSDSWHQIPWQIDELNENRVGYYFGDKNGIYESNEELLFIAQDAGDLAPSASWIDDEDSKNYPRYEFMVYDDLDQTYVNYVYVYRSATLQPDPTLPSYMSYTVSKSGNDVINAVSYLEGHTAGKPTAWQIPVSAGGSNINILNGQKARVNANVPIVGEIKITEEDLKYNYDNIEYLAGPIRVIREVTFKLKKSILGYTLELDLTFKKYYYPYYIEAFAPAKTLSSDWGIKLIRLSYDLSTSADGMTFYNPFNKLLIDGIKDVVDRSLLFAPEYNWFMATGDQGTYINIFRIDKIDVEQILYYWDSQKDDTYDGTYNSKLDYKSYGDTGVLLRGSKMEGKLGLPMRMLFLGANQDSLVGPALVDNVVNPLKNQQHEQSYTEPIIASMPDTSQQQGAFIDVPVRIEDVTGLNIKSFDFQLTYDMTVVDFREAVQIGTMTENWNPASLTTGDNMVSVNVSGSSALFGEGDLIKLRFKVIGAQGSSSTLHITQFSTSNSAVTVATRDGSVTALSPVEIMVAMPDTLQERGLPIAIPVTVSDVTGLEISSVNFVIRFDDDVLEIASISTESSLSNAWQTTSMSKIPDGAQISASGASFLEGQGTLLFINFDAIGFVDDTTSLKFTNFQFNEGVPVAALTHGSLTVLQPPLLATSVPDTEVVWGNNLELPILVDRTDGFGIKSASMTISYDPAVVNAVSVDNQGTLTSAWPDVQFMTDEGILILILSGEQPLVGAGEMVRIIFETTGKINDTTTVKIDEIQFNKGNPEGIRDAGFIRIISPTIAVNLPDTTGKNGELINIPVLVDDITGLDVTSVKLTISYDSRILDAIRVVQSGSLTENKGMLTFRDYTGSAYASFTGEALQGSGPLFFIQFSIIGEDGSYSPLILNYVTFNNGIPKSALQNGSLTVTGVVPRVQIAMPDTSGFEGLPTKIPVVINNLSGAEVFSCAMSITYNHDVLTATGVTQQGTLTESWQTATPELLQGKINISLSGSAPLTSSGTLIYIEFNSVGKPETSSILHFESVLFNDGVPIAITSDGMFSTLEMPVVSVALPDTGAYRLDGLLVPVVVGNVTDYDIHSFDCYISFNQDVVNAASIMKNNTLTESWTNVVFEKETNLIHVNMSGSEALIGEGTLFFIEMEVIGQPGDSTDLVIQQFRFDDGVPQAVLQNGVCHVYVIPQIAVALPDTIVMSGTSVQLPLTIGDLTGENVKYLNTMISYNPNVIKCRGVEIIDAIASQWDDITVNLFTNRIHLIMSGTNPLTGSGTLIYLKFDVIGSDSTSTAMNFMYFRFNDGMPIAVIDNGTLKIEGIIPVELSTFNAQYQQNAVYLSWSTATETNNYGFEIQKSLLDSMINGTWETIGFIKGHGTSAVVHSYEFVDRKLEADKLMYRLKQIDFDGRYSLSNSILVEIHRPETLELVQNYPNPFNGSTTIKYGITRPGRVSIKVYNLLGKEVATLVDGHQSQGRYSIDWSAKDDRGNELSSGIYFYRLESNGQIITKKMILLE